MQKCRVCGSTNFYKEAGYFFCEICQTQNQDIREEVLELRVDSTTRLRKTRIRQLKLDRTGDELGWTSWELYNFVLIGLTNELIELGVPSEIKLTVLQLWATYLGRIEVAFISTKKQCMPKLARRYKKRDADIIYGKVQLKKKSKKRRKIASSTNTSIISGGQSEGSTMREINKNKRLLATADYDRYLQSQASSEGDGLSSFSQSMYSIQSSSVKSSENEGKVQFSSHAKEETKKIHKLSKNVPRSERVRYRSKHISSKYKMSPHIVTPMRLWAIIYLALRIHNQPIQLGDMLRYGREGHLSYYKLDHLIPPEVSLTGKEKSFLTQNVEITHKGMRRIIASMAKFLGVWNIHCPDFSFLISRYCQELGLPRGIQLYTERLIALSPPKMTFDARKSCIPNYEGRAMAFIMVVLKILFALDGITEYQISRVAEKINSVAIDRGLLNEKLFSFHEWQKYIECRKTILVHTHFPTKMKYCPQSDGIGDLYLKFFEYITSKSNRQEPGIKSAKHALPEEIVNAMTKHVTSLNIIDIPSEAINIFPPSLTPLQSYFQYLLDHPFYDIPRIAQNNFLHTKVGYLTKPDMLTELAIQCGITIEVIDSSLHFLEKYVPPFEQARMPSVEELKESINVRDNSKDQLVRENVNLIEYLHAKEPCTVKFDNAKQNNYNRVQDTAENLETFNELKDFTFLETLPCGKLAVPMDSDDESEEENVDYTHDFEGTIMPRNKFHKGYNFSLSRAEKESIYKTEVMRSTQFRKPKGPLERNGKGQFVKSKAAPIKTTKCSIDPPVTMEHTRLCTKAQRSPIRETHTKAENIANNELSEHEGVNISNLQLNDTTIENGFLDLNEYLNLSDVSFFSECATTLSSAEKENAKVNGVHQFFRPFKDYWMYHCIFSRVKPANFTIFEKALPRTFRWLLNECALIVEMSAADLYEEVCLIETYHSQTLTSNSPKSSTRDNDSLLSKNQLNFILSKW